MRFKEAAQALGAIAETERLVFFRNNDESLYSYQFSDNTILQDKTISDLTAAFAVIVKKLAEKPQVLNIIREEITINRKLSDIFRLVSENPNGIRFERVFEKENSRLGLIVSFLALLELIHSSVVKYSQQGDFGEIFIYPYILENFHGV